MQENFSAVGFDDFGNLPFGDGFHHTIFTILAAHTVDLYNQHCSGNQYNPNADQGGDADDVHDGKQDEQGNDPAAQVPDILRSQSLELDAPVNAFVDLIYAVTHNCCFLPNNDFILHRWSCGSSIVELKCDAFPCPIPGSRIASILSFNF